MDSKTDFSSAAPANLTKAVNKYTMIVGWEQPERGIFHKMEKVSGFWYVKTRRSPYPHIWGSERPRRPENPHIWGVHKRLSESQ
jgi:hypothetical protein